MRFRKGVQIFDWGCLHALDVRFLRESNFFEDISDDFRRAICDARVRAFRRALFFRKDNRISVSFLSSLLALTCAAFLREYFFVKFIEFRLVFKQFACSDARRFFARIFFRKVNRISVGFQAVCLLGRAPLFCENFFESEC